MQKAYNPKEHEDAISELWENAQVSRPETKNTMNTGEARTTKTGQSFTVPMPPPNVTSKLHIGHSSMLTLEDIMTRYH